MMRVAPTVVGDLDEVSAGREGLVDVAPQFNEIRERLHLVPDHESFVLLIEILERGAAVLIPPFLVSGTGDVSVVDGDLVGRRDSIAIEFEFI